MTEQSKESKEKEKQMQEKFMEFQMLQQQNSQIQKQLQQIEAQKSEIENIKKSIDEMKKVEVGEEMLVPMASGIFAKAKLEKKDSLMVNVGKGIVVEKSFDEVKTLLDEQKTEVRKVEESLTEQMQKTTAKLGQIEKELNRMIEEAQKDV